MASPPSRLRRPADLTQGVFGVMLPELIRGYTYQAFYYRDLLAVERDEHGHALEVKGCCCLVSKASKPLQSLVIDLQRLLYNMYLVLNRVVLLGAAHPVLPFPCAAFRAVLSVPFYPRLSTRSVPFCTLQSQCLCLRRQGLQ
jgi:hypothetical protein